MQQNPARGRARRDADFETFVAGSSTRLLRSAHLLIGDHAIAEDLLQMTLMRTARRWPSAKAAPEAYARKVLVNLSRDDHRRRRFAVARLPRLKGFVAGGISRNLAAQIAEHNPYGLNAAYSHFVPYGGAPGIARGTRSGGFVIPGSRGACLSGSNLDGGVLPGLSCVPLASANSGSFHVTTGTANGSRMVVGLVPDGNASVTVLLAGGQQRTARVFDNVWSLTLPTGPATLLVKDATGKPVRVAL